MAERRNDEEIRREMAAEREGLAESLAALRQSVGERRKRAGVAGGALGGGLALAAAVKAIRRLRRDSSR